MEGPTPVSALIHAATMVTAGVYMVARLGALFSLSPTAMTVVAVIGTATAVLGATIALVQTDIKKVLAYSTVSQLGYMFLACGVGAFGVGVFHLFTHAFFKALLFLGSGSVIHALGGEQDMRKMGGLWRRIPVTFWTFVIGTLAIAGIPPLAGFYSKDAILGGALEAGRPVLFGVGLIVALLTAFYMTRAVMLTFLGRYRGDAETGAHIHESPWIMLGPLVILAVGSAIGGKIDIPHFVEPALRVGRRPTPPTIPAGCPSSPPRPPSSGSCSPITSTSRSRRSPRASTPPPAEWRGCSRTNTGSTRLRPVRHARHRGRQRRSALARRGRAHHRRRGQRGGGGDGGRRSFRAHDPGGAGAQLRPRHPGRRGGRPLLPAVAAMKFDILGLLVLLPMAGAIVHAFIPGARSGRTRSSPLP
jgi:hypothetical protein